MLNRELIIVNGRINLIGSLQPGKLAYVATSTLP